MLNVGIKDDDVPEPQLVWEGFSFELWCLGWGEWPHFGNEQLLIRSLIPLCFLDGVITQFNGQGLVDVLFRCWTSRSPATMGTSNGDFGGIASVSTLPLSHGHWNKTKTWQVDLGLGIYYLVDLDFRRLLNKGGTIYRRPKKDGETTLNTTWEHFLNSLADFGIFVFLWTLGQERPLDPFPWPKLSKVFLRGPCSWTMPVSTPAWVKIKDQSKEFSFMEWFWGADFWISLF